MSILDKLRGTKKREQEGIRVHLCCDKSVIDYATGGWDEVMLGDKTKVMLSNPSKIIAYGFNPILNLELRAQAKIADRKSDLILDFKDADTFSRFQKLYSTDKAKALIEFQNNIIYISPRFISRYSKEQ